MLIDLPNPAVGTILSPVGPIDIMKRDVEIGIGRIEDRGGEDGENHEIS